MVCVTSREGMGGWRRGAGAATTGGATVLAAEGHAASAHDGNRGLGGRTDRGRRRDADDRGRRDGAGVCNEAARARTGRGALMADGLVVARTETGLLGDAVAPGGGLGTRSAGRGGRRVRHDRRVLGSTENRQFAGKAVDLNISG